MNKRFVVSIICFMVCDAEQALVIKPIADMVGHPLDKSGLTYESQCVAGGTKNPYRSCPRAHQVLYNETVEIIRKHGDEVYIRLPHIFFITAQTKKPQSSFWTHKDNLIPIKQINDAYQAYIPPAPQYKGSASDQNQPYITLALPWYCQELDCTFSAGTRFVCKQPEKKASTVHVYALDPTNQTVKSLYIAKNVCIYAANHVPKQKALRTYRRILKAWTEISGYIPYVWGGCRLAGTNQHDAFDHIELELSKVPGSAYSIKQDTTRTKTGFDCAGLIARAAQTAGIPYYFKNTTTLATYLKPITAVQQIQDGDLIWTPWHVMAVGSIKHNTLIEARHYSHGYGKVHEIPLSRVFQDIHTYADLVHAMNQKKQLKRLDIHGKPVQTIKEVKLLSMQSAWDFSYEQIEKG